MLSVLEVVVVSAELVMVEYWFLMCQQRFELREVVSDGLLRFVC